MVSAAETLNGGGGDRHASARAEAAMWVVRTAGRGGGQKDAEADLLDRWLDADSANPDAYAQTQMVWDELGHILPDWKRDLPPARPAPQRRALVAVAAAICLAFISVLGWNWFSGPTTYRTAIGEQRMVMLADGSRITLNTDTEVAVARPGGERRLTLRRGEALFNVAHDPKHPFIVAAGGRQVRALGTSFVVRKEGERLEVVLLTGLVQVSADAGGVAPVRLTPGERYRLKSGAAMLDRPRIDVVTAWRNGELMLDETPLADAVAEMNRYRAKPIVLQGTGLGDLRISGVFQTRESEAFANTVGMIYGLRVNERPDSLLLTGRARTR